ncbi:hypothetical protein EJ02DRAFT_254775 [Clathrospora elynae]|uniref:Methyltransferase type 11 domain-containing protein n=1 Tax=Clathrospora elynae TaxID=706981 RepID=A0A6A5SLW2_9PLEO|nr:hypothetical protein EJ02DRAFT_254775 [Clathrospora elynae]
MFAADLTWVEPRDAEKVGARRERIAREQSITAESMKTSTSSRSSVSTNRELWWETGLKKAKSMKPKILRPSTSRSSRSARVPQKLDLKIECDLKDPAVQPGWTYSSTLSPTLPSGDALDLQEFAVPELEDNVFSRRTDSTQSRSSHDRQWEVRTPVTYEGSHNTMEEQRTSSGSFVTGRTRASSATPEHKGFASTPCPGVQRNGDMGPQRVGIEEALNLEALELHENPQEVRAWGETKHTPPGSISSRSRHLSRPFSEWECLTPRKVPMQMQLQPQPIENKVAVAHSSTIELTRFQRFIRRMEGTGAKTILDRLKEDWQEGNGEEFDEELALEKQLWLLTGFQMQNLGRDHIAPKPECDTGRILELYGNLSDVYQLSAMHPSQTVHFLTTQPRRPIPLPGNVSYLTVREFGAVPLPYPENYFSHIRASTLPSLVPSAKIPELFRECYKLLAPGGCLEIRIMDAAPVRKTAGPLLRTWIDDRLSVNLERLFRCSKPCLLVPSWLEDVGFELVAPEADQTVTLPCAFDPASVDTDKELSTIIGRTLWKDIWGSFVNDVPDEPGWWWEDEEIVEECLKRQTVLDCRAIFAYKR